MVQRALAWSVVVVPPQEVDRSGLHVMNVRAMRQAVLRLDPCPSYVLTDGFPIAGMPAPTLAVWKGDRVAACVAAASVVAKVTRDRMMRELHELFPQYDFAQHKGYSTPEHMAALQEHGPCAEHRFSYVNVRSLIGDGRMTPERPGEVRGRDGAAALPGVPRRRRAVRVGRRDRAPLLPRQRRQVTPQPDGEVWFELTLTDAWVWDMYRPARFVKTVRVLTFKDVNVEKLEKPDLELPRRLRAGTAAA